VATRNFDTIINQINEGLFDRAKANVAGAVGAVKGMGARISGTAGAAKAAFGGNTAGAQASVQKAAAGKQMGLDAKTQSIISSHQKKLAKAIDDFTGDLNKLKLSDPNSVNQLKQSLNAQVQSAVKAPAPTTATPTTSTSSGAPTGTTTTPSTASIGGSSPSSTSTAPAASTAASAPSAPGAASPTTGTPAAATPAVTSSPTTPTATLASPDSLKAADAKLKDLGNQEKILKGLMATDKKNTAQYSAQLKGLEAAKQAAIKEKQAAQAALKQATSAANKDAYKNKQQAAGMNLSVKPNLVNTSFVPVGTMFNELCNILETGLKSSKKFNLLS